MSQLEDFLRDHHNPIVSQLNAEIERLKRLAQSESDAKEMAWATITNMKLEIVLLKSQLEAEKDDEISVLKREMEYLRDELREANRMLDKYHGGSHER
jgi:chromosome segregation ATPase